MNIPSILRHWFTLAATAATLWLVGALMLSQDDAAKLTSEFSKLIDPLVGISVLLITAFWRVALTWGASLFRRGSGENDTNGSGGNFGLWVMGTMAACLCGLPSCSPEQLAAARAVPIKACVHTDQGDVCYSTKDGLSAEIDATSGK